MTFSAGHRLVASAAAISMLLAGCVSYLTPGAGAPVGTLAGSGTQADAVRIPEAPFPARLAIARVQAPGYRSYDAEGVGSGNYTVLFVRDVEKPDDFNAITEWPNVVDTTVLGSLALPSTLTSFADLRHAASNVGADVMFVYTLDTRFHIENKVYKPQEVITLGVLPGREAQVDSTASGIFVDVRTGFIYGLAENTALERTSMTQWTKPSNADLTRVKAERSAFTGMMTQARKTWEQILARYAPSTNATPSMGLRPYLPKPTPVPEPTPVKPAASAEAAKTTHSAESSDAVKVTPVDLSQQIDPSLVAKPTTSTLPASATSSASTASSATTSAGKTAPAKSSSIESTTP